MKRGEQESRVRDWVGRQRECKPQLVQTSVERNSWIGETVGNILFGAEKQGEFAPIFPPCVPPVVESKRMLVGGGRGREGRRVGAETA